MKTGLLLDAHYADHDPGPGHPECPERYAAVTRALTAAGWVERLQRIESRPAFEDEVALCHPRDYIRLAHDEVAAGRDTLSTGDTDICPHSFDVAMRAVGGLLNAVDALVEGRVRRAFAAVRPPGHHARPAQGMGFCLFNSIAIAARYAQTKHGLGKVAIVDWDVHHGNGTQDIFYEDPSVFFFSSHQHPWYPFTGSAEETGAGKAKGTTMNVPLPAGSGMKEIGGAFEERLLPALDAFRPELVLISAGFDSRRGDPLGQFRLEDTDFQTLTRHIREIADRHAEGRVLSVLEGGYSLDGLAKAVTAHVEALAE